MSWLSGTGLVVIGGCFAAVISCGGSAVEEVGGSAPTAAEFPAQLQQVACDTIEACCMAAQLPFDRAGCLKEFNLTAVETGDGLVYDSAAAQRCIAEFKSATQGCSSFDKSQLLDCNLVTVGTLPLGAACTGSRACASPPGQLAACEFELNGVGTCALQPSSAHGAAGDACESTCTPDGTCAAAAAPAGVDGPPQPRADCYVSDGLYCALNTSDCVAVGNSGDTCYASEGCATGLVCVGFSRQFPADSVVITPGTCGPPQPDGNPCVTSDQCASHSCDGSTGFCVHVALVTPNLCLGIAGGGD